MKVELELGEDFHSWYNCCLSLDVDPNINKFLYYVNYYGTYANLRIPED